MENNKTGQKNQGEPTPKSTEKTGTQPRPTQSSSQNEATPKADFVASAVENFTDSAREKVENFCREKPWSAVAIGFSVGLGVGLSPAAALLPQLLSMSSRELLNNGDFTFSNINPNSIGRTVFLAASKMAQEKIGNLNFQSPHKAQA